MYKHLCGVMKCERHNFIPSTEFFTVYVLVTLRQMQKTLGNKSNVYKYPIYLLTGKKVMYLPARKYPLTVDLLDLKSD